MVWRFSVPARHDARLIRAAVFVVLLLAGPVSAEFDPGFETHLSVFGRVPSRVNAQVELELSRFEIFAAADTLRFAPTRAVVSSSTDAGRARSLLRATFAPGRIDSLRVVFASARVLAGEAETRVDLEGVSSTTALTRETLPGECLVVYVDFDPDATAVDAVPWRPSIRFGFPERPPLGQGAFVALEGGGTVAVLDRRTGFVAAEFGTGGRPTDVIYSALERRLFVAVAGRDEIVAVDFGDIDRVRRLPLRFGDEPTRLLLSEDERDVYVLSAGHDALITVSSQTFQETSRVPLSPRPVAIVNDARSGNVYVSSESARIIEVVDPARGAVIQSFNVRETPGEMVFLPRSSELLVAARDGRSLERVDVRSGASVESIELCGPARGLDVQQRSERVYVAMDLCRELSVLRPRLDLEIDRRALPGSPGRLRLDPEERMLLVPMPEEGTLLSINTSRLRGFSVYDVGPRPVAVIVP